MRSPMIAAALAALLSASGAAPADPGPAAERAIERGRYLVMVAGCNDCHTPGYLEKDGKVAEADWLTGTSVGFQGPWGTTYPANLRLVMQTTTEADWLRKSRASMRPPMPWFNLAAMSDADLRAIYAYVRSLEPKGQPAPAYAPPGARVETPYYDFVPKNLPARAAAGRPG